MLRRLRRAAPALAMLLLSACGLGRCGTPQPLDDAAMAALYARPAPPPAHPLRVFHIGHSLVGRDMPAMLAQLADAGLGADARPRHAYESELGWGATLKGHWGDAKLAGFAAENDHPRFRAAGEAVDSGAYDAVVLTEMVEIRDAIAYFDSPDYLHRWARRAWDANPQTRVYLYETWHPLDDPEGWLARLDADLARYWEGRILRGALAWPGMDRPIYLIPAGQVMAAFIRAAEARGGVDGIAAKADLFADTIHLNDLGAYLVALTHYAVLYGRSPVGLPRQLSRADGTPAAAPGPEAARLMQEIVWETVTRQPLTGVNPRLAAGG